MQPQPVRVTLAVRNVFCDALCDSKRFTDGELLRNEHSENVGVPDGLAGPHADSLALPGREPFTDGQPGVVADEHAVRVRVAVTIEQPDAESIPVAGGDALAVTESLRVAVADGHAERYGIAVSKLGPVSVSDELGVPVAVVQRILVAVAVAVPDGQPHRLAEPHSFAHAQPLIFADAIPLPLVFTDAVTLPQRVDFAHGVAGGEFVVDREPASVCVGNCVRDDDVDVFCGSHTNAIVKRVASCVVVSHAEPHELPERVAIFFTLD